MANSDSDKAKKSERGSFFGRHGRLISVIGASIVLATYLVKDELRDRAKDAADAANQNLASYQLRSDIRQINEHLLTLQTNEMNHYNDLRTSGSGETPGQRVQSALNDVRRQLNDGAQGRFAEATAAASILNSFRPQYAQSLNAGIDKYKNQFAPIQNEIDYENKHGGTPDPNFKDPNVLVELKAIFDGLYSEMDKYQKMMLDDLLSDRDSTERNFQFYNRCAPLIYLVGWFAALAGQWYGIKGLSGE